MKQTINVGLPMLATPGDEFTFVPPDAATQYHFAVTPADPTTLIGVWNGTAGVARNKPGVPYVDHVCGNGQFTVTVTDTGAKSYTISVTANSTWTRIFGSVFTTIKALFGVK